MQGDNDGNLDERGDGGRSCDAFIPDGALDFVDEPARTVPVIAGRKAKCNPDPSRRHTGRRGRWIAMQRRTPVRVCKVIRMWAR
jgi:hypothetical protein